MPVRGGQSDGWFLVNRDGAKEYREVSTDGTEENTKQQSRSHETLTRVRQVCHTSANPVTGFWTDEGAMIVSPSYKMPWGVTFFAHGIWTVVSHQFQPGQRGSDLMIETQVIKTFTSYKDI